VDKAVQALDALGNLGGAKSAATNAPATSKPLDLLNRFLPKR